MGTSIATDDPTHPSPRLSCSCFAPLAGSQHRPPGSPVGTGMFPTANVPIHDVCLGMKYEQDTGLELTTKQVRLRPSVYRQDNERVWARVPRIFFNRPANILFNEKHTTCWWPVNRPVQHGSTKKGCLSQVEPPNLQELHFLGTPRPFHPRVVKHSRCQAKRREPRVLGRRDVQRGSKDGHVHGFRICSDALEGLGS